MWGIWCNDTKDWLREPQQVGGHSPKAVLAYKAKRDACTRAAEEYGSSTYTEAKKSGWCEVRPLTARS